MRTFVFHLQQYLGNRFKRKRIEFDAKDTPTAYDQVKRDYPEWGISMFWPK